MRHFKKKILKFSPQTDPLEMFFWASLWLSTFLRGLQYLKLFVFVKQIKWKWMEWIWQNAHTLYSDDGVFSQDVTRRVDDTSVATFILASNRVKDEPLTFDLPAMTTQPRDPDWLRPRVDTGEGQARPEGRVPGGALYDT